MEINQAAPKFQDVSIAPMHTAKHSDVLVHEMHISKRKKANVITNFRLAQRRSKFMPLKKK